MKRVLSLLILLCATSPSRAQQPPPTARAASTTTADGLIIMPVEVEPDDVSTMLEITLWRFEIHKPARFQLDYRLELRQPGKNPIRMTTGVSSLAQDEEITFSLMPEEGQVFTTSRTLKICRRSKSLAKDDDFGNSHSVGRYKNPIIEFKFSSSRIYSLGQIKSDGSIVLVKFDPGKAKFGPGEEAPAKGKLVLVLTSPKPEPPK